MIKQFYNRRQLLCFLKISIFFLSNFAPCKIELNGLIFHSVEAAFQAAKTENLGIMETFCNLMPLQAKRKGRTIKLRSDWEKLNIQ